MASLNTVTLLANLTRDVEVRYTPNGSPVGSMGVAMNNKYKTKAGELQEETTFVDVEVWGSQAENCAKFLSKGSQVLIEGRLKMDEWDDATTGKKRSRLKVVANNVQFLGGRDSGGTTVPESRTSQTSHSQNRGGRRVDDQHVPRPSSAPAAKYDNDAGEIPF